MKRRFLSQVLPRQDVCLLCASRLNNVSSLRRRAFVISPRLSQSPAAQTKDENDESFSMLRQNAGLSFPSRRPPPTSPSAQVQPPGSHVDSYKKEPKSGTQFRDNKADSGSKVPTALPKGANQRVERERSRNRDPPSWRKKAKGDQAQVASQNDNEKRKLFRTVRTHGPSGAAGPFPESMQVHIPQKFHDGYGRDKRKYDINTGIRRASNQGLSQYQPLLPPQKEISIKKFPTQQNMEFLEKAGKLTQEIRPGTRTVKIQQTSDWGKSSLESEEVIPDTVADASSRVPGTIDAPVGSTFIPLDGSHHRRHTKDDRRARRSDRFDEGDVQPAAQNITHKPKTRERGRRFDIEALEAEEALYGEGERRRKKKRSKQDDNITPSRPIIHLPEFIGVERLAQMLKINVDIFIDKLEEEGFEGARYDHVLDSGTSAMFAELYGFEPAVAGAGPISDLVARPPPEDLSVLQSRPPIVTIMGHVDHGKTTILDFFRKSSVVASEHGGITQHIGAFSVTMPGTNKQITFLDTPGHAAFLEMRRRGANVTDIVVLVVAADDSVKPQTIEAIKHSLDANVQIIVAINKVDKPEADVDRVKQDLTRHDIVVEDYGGDYQVIPVSGKTGQGMADLEEAIITLSDVNDYRAEVDGPAEGWVIESKVTTSGRVATVLVRRGTLRTGDCIVAGTTWARVRTLRNDAGVLVDAAPPGTPVQVDGWRGEDPTAGLEVLQAESEENAKEVVDMRLEQEENMKTAASMTAINNARSEEAEARAKTLAWEREQEWSKKSYGLRPKDNEGWVEAQESSGPQKVHFVVKADVAGSVEALVAAVSAVGNNEIVANVIHSGTGQLTESDIRMLATTGERGYAVSFNQALDGNVARLAEAAGLSVLDHNIIYKVTDNVKDILGDHLPPVITQRVLGEAEIGQVFEVTLKRHKVKIAGCRITNGTISRSSKVRVLRDSEVVYTGQLGSLKNVKKDVTEMRKGTECGMGFEEWEDFQEGDQVQCFEEHHEKRTLY